MKTRQQSISTEYYLRSLKEGLSCKNLLRDLVDLEVALRTEPLTWVSEFLKFGGDDSLLDLLNRLNQKNSFINDERECQYQCIRALKALMNNTIGFQSVMEYPNGVDILAMAMDCDNLKMKTVVIQLLAATCLVSCQFHQMVLNAATKIALQRNEKRFVSLVADLNGEDLEYQIASLAFVNSIVNSYEETANRLLLRQEFNELGFDMIVEKLRRKSRDSELLTQISLYEETADDDNELLMEGMSIQNINMGYPFLLNHHRISLNFLQISMKF